jgi:hypothetical protein
MRTSPAGGMVFGMDGERTRLTVELESDSEPIAGQIEESGGAAHEFKGYMGLIEALERVRRSPTSLPDPPVPEEGLSHAP